MFYNTVPLFSDELLEAREDANCQDDLVLSVFKKCAVDMSPSMVYNWLLNTRQINPKTPLTSFRRAISSLTKRGYLEKTGNKVKGFYGRKECQWKLCTPKQ